MPALTLSDAIFNPQVQSKFFILSLELRQAIYSYLVPHGIHINIRPGIFSVSVCVQSCPNDSSYGEERRWRLTPYTVSDTVYPRRLRSSWGLHWECEEIALGTNHTVEELRDTRMDFMLTCKRMRADLVDFLIDVAPCHVTDLTTLHHILQPTFTPISEFWAVAVTRIQILSITLRLPLKTFEGIEQFHENKTDSNVTNTPAWLTLCPAIKGLKQLRKLHLWADHTSTETWTLVNERAFLSPLEELSKSSNLDISVILPKLFPRYESPARHYVHTSPPPPYTLIRRLRQRWHAPGPGKYSGSVIYAQDFPILFVGDSDDDLEVIERRERKAWEDGEDVEAL